MSALLTPAEIHEALAGMAHWAHKEGALVKRYHFATYMDGIRFVELVAAEAESRDHHPDLLVGYREVTAFLSTHSAGGVTRLDVDLARAIEAIAPVAGAR
jgi:4a-hydroxytetrahydrobiopterin dehydratase